MKSILYNYTPEDLQELLNDSNSYADLLRKIGLCPKGKNPETLQKIIKEYQLDESILDKNRRDLYSQNAKNTHCKIKTPLEEIFNGKHPNYNSSKLIKRLIEEGYKDYKCELCGLKEWLNRPLSLQLHHKDGNHSNNKLENLQILCPNCHSQTDTYSGKSSQKTKEKKKYFEDKLNLEESDNK